MFENFFLIVSSVYFIIYGIKTISNKSKNNLGNHLLSNYIVIIDKENFLNIIGSNFIFVGIIGLVIVLFTCWLDPNLNLLPLIGIITVLIFAYFGYKIIKCIKLKSKI